MKFTLLCGVAAIAAALALNPLPVAAEAGITQVQFPKGKSSDGRRGWIDARTAFPLMM